MKNEYNYYKEQFLMLTNDPHINFGYFPSIVIYDNRGNKTKQVDLNLESIPLLIDQLKRLAKQLETNNNTDR